jgi:hypothetical protein
MKKSKDSSIPQILREATKSNREFLFLKCSSPRIPKQKKAYFHFQFAKVQLLAFIEHDITNLSFEILFLFQTDMFRNYLNFIKSKLNFRCFKQIGSLGNKKANSPNLK